MVNRCLSMMSALLLVAVAAGCGSSTSGSGSAEPPPRAPAIVFRSPVLKAGVIPTRYKCDGRRIWLPLSWGALPAGTKELVVYVARFGPPKIAAGSAPTAAILAQELIVGLNPTLHGLTVGKLPHGALIGAYEEGVKSESICPKRGAGQGLIFDLYALRQAQNIGKGHQSGNLLVKLKNNAAAIGAFTASFPRS
jgi:hypothetical protein